MALTSPRFRDNDQLQKAADNNPVLKRFPSHATGEGVKLLQQALKDLRYQLPVSFRGGGPDGIYGAETEGAVRRFQIDQGFPFREQDGRAGRNTLHRLDSLFPPAPAPTTSATVRKRSSRLTVGEQQTFRETIIALIDSGVYGQFVAEHAKMQHNMHTMPSMSAESQRLGRGRFLPWHRAFVRKLELEMQRINPAAFVPYWAWSVDRQIPDWIASFMPNVTNIPVRGPDGATRMTSHQVTRTPGRNEDLPSASQVADAFLRPTYLAFTTAWEDGPHNFVHGWVGGSMGLVQTAPADPIFWLHHGEIDRVWALWQDAHPGQTPVDGQGNPLTGLDAILTPWGEPVSAYENIRLVGYSYEAL